MQDLSATRISFALRIPGQPQYVSVARLALSGFANQLGLPFDEVQDLKLALSEACSYLLRRESGQGAIEVECALHQDSLDMRVTRNVPDPVGQALAILGLQPAGRDEPLLGLALIAVLMDDVRSERDCAGQGLTLRMRRSLERRSCR